MAEQRQADDIGEELEQEALRRRDTHVVIPAGGKTYTRLRRFGRRWLWVQVGVTILIALFALFLFFTMGPRSTLPMLPGLLISLAGIWFAHRVHYRTEPPALILAPEGLYTTALPQFGPLPWDEIVAIQGKPLLGQQTVRLQIRDMRSLRARLSPRDRRNIWLFRLPGKTLAINAIPFGGSGEEVAQRLQRYWLYGPTSTESPVERIMAATRAATEEMQATAELGDAPLPTLPASTPAVTPTVTVVPAETVQVQSVGRKWWQD